MTDWCRFSCFYWVWADAAARPCRATLHTQIMGIELVFWKNTLICVRMMMMMMVCNWWNYKWIVAKCSLFVFAKPANELPILSLSLLLPAYTLTLLFDILKLLQIECHSSVIHLFRWQKLQLFRYTHTLAIVKFFRWLHWFRWCTTLMTHTHVVICNKVEKYDFYLYKKKRVIFAEKKSF